jgi:hypothetical protein
MSENLFNINKLENNEKQPINLQHIADKFNKDIDQIEIEILEKEIPNIISFISKVSKTKKRDVEFILKIFLLEILSNFHKNKNVLEVYIPFIGVFSFTKIQDDYVLTNYRLSSFLKKKSNDNSKNIDLILKKFLED